MASIRIKRSATTGSAPSSLLLGELAVNTADARLWVGDVSNAPVELGAAGGGSATPAPAVLRAVLDGYALHAWNNPRLSGLYPSPCLITVGASGGAVPSGFTRAYDFSATGAPFVSGGGNPVTASGATSFPVVTPSGTVKVGRHWRVSTLLDGTQVAFRLDSDATADGGYRFLVDGRYVSMQGTVSGSGADRWYTLRFSGRSKRTITVEGYGALRFWSAAVPDSDTLLNPVTGVSPRIVLVGDSDLEAYSLTLKGDGPGAVLSDYIGVPDVFACGVYSTGFLATSYGANYNYGQRRSDWADAAPDMVVWSQSINDLREGHSASAIASAVVAEIQAARAALGAQTPLAIVGYLTDLDVLEAEAPGATALLIASENAAHDAVAALDDPLVAYVRIVTAGIQQAVTGAADGQGNYSLYMNAATRHATAAGYVAGGIVNATFLAQTCAALLGAELPLPLPPTSAAAQATAYPKRLSTPKIAGDVGGTALTTRALTAAGQYFVPLSVPRAVILTGLRISVTTASAGSASVGVYANTTDASGNDAPGALLASATGLDTGSTGNKDGAFAAPVLLEPGTLYWVSVIGSAAATLRALPVGAMQTVLGRTVGKTTAITGLYAAGSGSTMPATAAATLSASTGSMFALYLIEQ
jgi:hypothetical protein